MAINSNLDVCKRCKGTKRQKIPRSINLIGYYKMNGLLCKGIDINGPEPHEEMICLECMGNGYRAYRWP